MKILGSNMAKKIGLYLFCVGYLLIPFAESACSLPSTLATTAESKIPLWPSHITRRGLLIGKRYYFDKDTMNVTTSEGIKQSFKCYQSVTFHTFLLSLEDGNPGSGALYKCVKFDQWSTNVVQIYESELNATPSDVLCSEDNLKADPWLLAWKYLDNGYVPCPDLGGYNMEVLSTNGTSFCDGIYNQEGRLESECIYGEGIKMDFRSYLCKGNMPVRNLGNLLCLGHKTIGQDIHIIVVDPDPLPRLFSMRFIKPGNNGENINMYFSVDITLNLTKADNKKTWNIVLAKKPYPTRCEDEYPGCTAPDSCQGKSLKRCQTTCKNFTTCLSDQPSCTFEQKLKGQWMELSKYGQRMIEIHDQSAHLDKLDSFECLGILSSTQDGLKPVVKVFKNGCKPRYACLDMEYFTPSVVKYRISQTIAWPHKANLVRGDICTETYFEDDRYPFSHGYRSRNHKVLVRPSKSKSNSGRSHVPCNIPHGIRFKTESSNGQCTGSLNVCQSGDVMVLTYNSDCQMPQNRVFYKCLAEFKTRTQQYVFTERNNNSDEVHCWVFKDDPLGTRDSVLLQLHSGDCSNETSISLGGYNDRERIPYLQLFTYMPSGSDTNADSCIDMSSIRSRQTTTTTTPTTTTETSTTISPTTTIATTLATATRKATTTQPSTTTTETSTTISPTTTIATTLATTTRKATNSQPSTTTTETSTTIKSEATREATSTSSTSSTSKPIPSTSSTRTLSTVGTLPSHPTTQTTTTTEMPQPSSSKPTESQIIRDTAKTPSVVSQDKTSSSGFKVITDSTTEIPSGSTSTQASTRKMYFKTIMPSFYTSGRTTGTTSSTTPSTIATQTTITTKMADSTTKLLSTIEKTVSESQLSTMPTIPNYSSTVSTTVSTTTTAIPESTRKTVISSTEKTTEKTSNYSHTQSSITKIVTGSTTTTQKVSPTQISSKSVPVINENTETGTVTTGTRSPTKGQQRDSTSTVSSSSSTITSTSAAKTRTVSTQNNKVSTEATTEKSSTRATMSTQGISPETKSVATKSEASTQTKDNVTQSWVSTTQAQDIKNEKTDKDKNEVDKKTEKALNLKPQPVVSSANTASNLKLLSTFMFSAILSFHMVLKLTA